MGAPIGTTPQAVLFDMTGTLHAQTHLANGAIAAFEVLARHTAVPPNELFAAAGPIMRAAFGAQVDQPFYLMRDVLVAGLDATFASLGQTLDPGLADEALVAFDAGLLRTVEPYPGALHVLQKLRAAGIRTAVVSVNDEALLQAIVDTGGFRPHLDVVLSSEAARSCKPDPVIFRTALERLGVDAADAVFVGDMPEMDIVGARRVGMRTVLTVEDRGVIGDLLDVGPEGEADHVITKIVELPTLLGL